MRRRYLYGFALAAAILALVGLGVVTASQRYRSDSGALAHTYDVIGRIERVRASLLDAVSSQRNYLLTGQPAYRDAHDREREQLRTLTAELGLLVRDNPVQTRRAGELDREIGRRLEYTARGIQIYADDGFEAARRYVVSNPGLELSKVIERHLAQMRAAEEDLLRQRSRASARSAWTLLGLGVLGIPLSLLILGIVYVLLSREVRERAAAEASAGGLNLRLAETVSGLERASSELRQLSQYAGLLQSCQSIPEALDITRRTLLQLMPDTGGTVYLLRPSQDYAEAEASWGMHYAASQPLLSPHDCWALRRGQPHIVERLHEGLACTHIETPRAEDPPATAACLPLYAQGVQMGFLFLSAHGDGPMPHLAVAVNAAEQLSLTLTNLRLQETLRQQSIRDPLTGLYNRRYLEESLQREIARCERRKVSLALLMLDLDHFKRLNDTYGHDCGDAVLAAFGQLLSDACREEDIPCRYGGEEFTLILPEIDLEAARARAERIRASVEAMTVRHMQRDIQGITASIGLAMCPSHASSGPLLKRLADEALYRAKHGGRNRVELAGDPRS